MSWIIDIDITDKLFQDQSMLYGYQLGSKYCDATPSRLKKTTILVIKIYISY